MSTPADELVDPLVGNVQAHTSAEATTASATLKHRVRILVALLDHPEGLTAGHLAQLCGMNTNNAGSRLLELRGEVRTKDLPILVQRTDEVRKMPSGRNGKVHTLTDLGRTVAMALVREADGD